MTASAPSLVSLIGERVRARRRARGWTLDELAGRSGVSRRMLVNVEQGMTNASIATLLRLSEALGVGLPTLVAPDSAMAPFDVTRAGVRPPLWRGEHGGEGRLMAAIAAPEVVELWDWSMRPGESHASEPHPKGTRELLTVIDGEMVVWVAGVDARLRAGDGASFPGDAVHGYRNDSRAPVRFTLAVYEPARTNGAPR